MYRLSRLVEAYSLLDKVQTHLHNPTTERDFNFEEIMVIVNTLTALKTILLGEIADRWEISSAALGICDM